MGIAELIFIALALSMDAFAVGLTNGMTESKMKIEKILLVAAFYGVFQCMMPLIGYFASSVFSTLIERIAPYLSFALLAFIGGKMLFDGVSELVKNKKSQNSPTHARETVKKERKPLDIKTLTAQALATSIDALAVGVTFLALDTAGTLCLNVWANCLIIGLITFTLSVGAVFLGKAIGDKLADKAEIFGGTVLLLIGLKILLDGLLI
ncbi:MAG: manganese efflux pump [Clostridia bacterium]|nr:manganese efflux pump [Clostridia bacterium]